MSKYAVFLESKKGREAKINGIKQAVLASSIPALEKKLKSTAFKNAEKKAKAMGFIFSKKVKKLD